MADPMARMGGHTSLSGLTEEEAKGFHSMFITSFLVFTLIACAAHYAVWQWRPWIPGVSGYKTTATATAPAVTNPTATAVATR